MFDDILNTMKSIAIIFSFIFSSLWVSLAAQADEQAVVVVGAEFWASPRHAEQLLTMLPLQTAVQQLLQEPEAYLVVSYPAGESGELWGLEFQAWLVSLGVVSDRIELRAGYEGDDGIAVIMVMPAASEPPIEEQAIQENSRVDEAPVVAPAPVQDEVEVESQ